MRPPSGFVPVLFACALLLLPACSSIEVGEDEVFQNKPTVTPATFAIAGMTLEEVFFVAADGARLNAWWLTQPDAVGTVLFFGGNGFFLVHSEGYLEAFARLPVNVFMMDYRGYGRSEGQPGIEKLKSDALAALDFAQERFGVEPERTVAHGHSLGTYLALYLAENRDVAGAVLENPITTADDWAGHLIPWYLRLFVRLDPAESLAGESNLRRVEDVKEPLLIFGGTDDFVADPEMARALDEAAAPGQARLVMVEGGGHNRLFENAAYLDAYAQFLGTALPGAAARLR